MNVQRVCRFILPFRLRYLAVLFVGMAVAGVESSTEVRAQSSPETSATYGRGVHAYFANRTTRAEQLFSQAIQAGSTDPRVYYFRAMARLRMGRQYEAEDDMKTGAAYEARNPGNRRSVGIALQRIQGQGRRTLERFRREGRLDRVQQRRQQSQLRYERLEQRGPQVLRREAPLRLEQLAEPSIELTAPIGQPSAPPASSEVPQVGVPPRTEVEGPTPAAPMPAPETGELPVPSPAPPGEEVDLFSDPTPQPEDRSEAPADPSPKPKASDSIDDIFDEPVPSEPATPSPAPAETEDDLFGDASETETAAETDADPPMTDGEGAAESADAGDLFGDDPTTEESPSEEASEPESTDSEEDVFGDPATAEPAPEPAEAGEEDFFGDEPAAEDESPDETEPPAAEEGESGEESPEAADLDDLFGSAAAEEKPAAEANLPAKDKDKEGSGKLFGILGRVVGSAVPWRNIQLPIKNPLPGVLGDGRDASSAVNIPLGPGPSGQGEVAPASGEKPLETTPEEDLFGGNAIEPSSEAAKEESQQPEEDDIFDDF